MKDLISASEAVAMISDGATIMFGGFMGCGNPTNMVNALLERETTGITLIANDCAFPSVGIGKLVVARRVKRIITSHVGTNPHVSEQMNEKFVEIELVPQGTLAERVRAAGAGLGGILTPTGVGTVVEEGKEVITVNGKAYLLELPLFADIALLRAWKADESGNLVFRRSARNFNPLMAMAAKLVIAEVEEIVPVGAIDPDQVHTPSLLVDYLVQVQE
jgi:3-oxoacid CoA-transferase, A subunit